MVWMLRGGGGSGVAGSHVGIISYPLRIFSVPVLGVAVMMVLLLWSSDAVPQKGVAGDAAVMALCVLRYGSRALQ